MSRNISFACMLQRENGTPYKSLITLGTNLYRSRHGPVWSAAEEISPCGHFLSDGSETPELSLHPLFEEYHAQVG
jgi:hypothetical protein